MDYTSIVQRGPDIVLTGIKNFVPAQVLDNGQCFRWQGDGGRYSGIAHGRRLVLSLTAVAMGDELIFEDVTQAEFEKVWKDYFDLGRDYGELRLHYSADKTLAEAIAYSPGLRIMKQDPWETLLTFILSQNSNIPRIKGMVTRLCECFGSVLPCGGFAFPTPEAIASAGDLSAIKSGYRADYIMDAARRTADGRLNLDELQHRPTDDVRQLLMAVHGVGPKVADCVLLFGFGRIECFPLDVWMKRVMADYYPNGFAESLMDTAGIAQQFLFHFVRTKGK